MPSFTSPEGLASDRPFGNKAAWISEELNRRTLLGARSPREIALCCRMLSSSRPNSFLFTRGLREPRAVSADTPEGVLGNGLKPVLLNEMEKLESRACWPLLTYLPLLH
jgi:hypothetical protein